jgi:DNA adenine methylase
MRSLTPPLKWHGGKHYLAERIIALMPPHVHYVEPFFGGGAVLLARDLKDPALWLPPHKGVSEVVNDLDGTLMNFWRTMKDPTAFEAFRRKVEATPTARAAWDEAHAHVPGADPVADAVAFFVECRQSRAGQRASFTPLTRNRTRRQMNGNVSEWWSAVKGLRRVYERLRRVAVENMPAVDLIRRHDGPNTLYYCDPPYLHQTRASTKAYRFEMTEAQHQELLTVLLACKGKVMISGYPSHLYDTVLAGWARHTFDLANHAAGGADKRRMTEVLWRNFRTPAGGAAGTDPAANAT